MKKTIIIYFFFSFVGTQGFAQLVSTRGVSEKVAYGKSTRMAISLPNQQMIPENYPLSKEDFLKKVDELDKLLQVGDERQAINKWKEIQGRIYVDFYFIESNQHELEKQYSSVEKEKFERSTAIKTRAWDRLTILMVDLGKNRAVMHDLLIEFGNNLL